MELNAPKSFVIGDPWPVAGYTLGPNTFPGKRMIGDGAQSE